MVKRREREGGIEGEEEASRRGPKPEKGKRGSGGSFGDVLQKALQQKGPQSGSKGQVGSGAKGNVELKKRIKEEKAAREEKKLLVEKRKWFQKEHVVPVRMAAHAHAAKSAECVGA